MTLQYSVAVRNARLDAVEATIGASAVLKFFTGAQPANCAAANSGVELASISAPADWMAAASGGTKAMTGTWQVAGSAAGTVGHFRLFASDGTTCGAQGSVTLTAGGGDMTVDDTSVAIGKVIRVTGFTLTAGNG